jgi:hypothetical protein
MRVMLSFLHDTFIIPLKAGLSHCLLIEGPEGVSEFMPFGSLVHFLFSSIRNALEMGFAALFIYFGSAGVRIPALNGDDGQTASIYLSATVNPELVRLTA